MEQSAKAVASGDLTLNVRLRRNDEMKPLADKMNLMVAGLKGKVDQMYQDYELLDEEIALLKARWASCELTPEASLELAAEICERSSSLLARLKEVKTD
jgi:methyl-accepting chemotaxis protein